MPPCFTPLDTQKDVEKSVSPSYGALYGKILDNIILSVQQEELKTSDLQFGYKSESSTIMCSTMVIETIQYINVYCRLAVHI